MRQLADSSFARAHNVRCLSHGQLWNAGRFDRLDGRYLIHLTFCCGCEETVELVKTHETYQQKLLFPLNNQERGNL